MEEYTKEGEGLYAVCTCSAGDIREGQQEKKDGLWKGILPSNFKIPLSSYFVKEGTDDLVAKEYCQFKGNRFLE